MKTYESVLTISTGETFRWTWQAEDAEHALEQLTDDPALYQSLGKIVEIRIKAVTPSLIDRISEPSR